MVNNCSVVRFQVSALRAFGPLVIHFDKFSTKEWCLFRNVLPIDCATNCCQNPITMCVQSAFLYPGDFT